MNDAEFLIKNYGEEGVIRRGRINNYMQNSLGAWVIIISNDYYLENDLIFLPSVSSLLQHFAALAVLLSYLGQILQTSYSYHLAEI